VRIDVLFLYGLTGARSSKNRKDGWSSLGRDHSITYPIVETFARFCPGLTIFHFDAHSDFCEEFGGKPVVPCGSVCADHGIGTGEAVGAGRDSHPNRHQREQLQRFGVEAVEMQPLPAYEKLKSAEPVYLTFDMDVLDPAFAPGVWHREPGEC